MRRFLVLAGVLTALAGCNPPAKQISVPCNCNGTVTPANPAPENQRFAPPAATEEAHYRTGYRHHRSAQPFAEGRATHGYHNAYEGSDDYYARNWSASRVAMSSYDYRSTSRVIYSGESPDGYGTSRAYASESFAEGPDDAESGWQDGYGRMHHGTQLSRGEFHARMDPWHGYDVDCYDRHHRRHRHRY